MFNQLEIKICIFLLLCHTFLASGHQQISPPSSSNTFSSSSSHIRTPSQSRIISSILHDPSSSSSPSSDPFSLLSTSELLSPEWSSFIDFSSKPSISPPSSPPPSSFSHSSSFTRSLSSLRSSLLSFHHDLLVEVRLVGFPGLSPRRLQSLLDALPPLRPLFGLDAHALNASTRLLYAVSRAPAPLLAAVHAARASLLSAAAAQPRRAVLSHEGTDLLLADPLPLHAVLLEDHLQRGARAGAVLYVLDEPADAQYPLFAYAPEDAFERQALAACPFQAMAGSRGHAGEAPVVWLDLAAGPLRYGPMHSGAGTVTHITFPSAFEEFLHVDFEDDDDFQKNQQQQKKNQQQQKKNQQQKNVNDNNNNEEELESFKIQRHEFSLALAGLLDQSVQRLLIPPLFFARSTAPAMRPWETVLFKLVWALESAQSPAASPALPSDPTPAPSAAAPSASVYSAHNLFNDTLLAPLLREQLPLLPGVRVDFEVREPAHLFDLHWPLHLAYLSAVTGSFSASGHYERTLDSAIMRSHLQKWWGQKRAAMKDEASRAFSAPGEASAFDVERGLVVPIFVFEFTHESMATFEDRSSSKVFDDMIIVLRFPGRRFSKDHCEHTTLSIDAYNVTRQLIASVLSFAWNLSPQESFWDHVHGQQGKDYLWSPNPGPLSALSNAVSLSFFHAEIAQRNALYARLAALQERLVAQMDPLIYSGYHLHSLLPADDWQLFVQRWNMLELKLVETAKQMSLGKMQSAYLFLRSCWFDAEVLDRLLKQARSSITSSLSCLQEGHVPTTTPSILTNPPSLWIDYLFGPILTSFLLVFLLFRLGFKKKKD